MVAIFGRGRRATALAFLALVVAGSYLWSLRPLSETEQKLVGTWARNSDSRIQLRLGSDRRAFLQVPSTRLPVRHSDSEPAEDLEFLRIGSWSASKKSLTVWKGSRGSSRRSMWRYLSSPPSGKNELAASRGGWGGRNPSRMLQLVETDYIKLDSELYFRVQNAQ